MTIKLYLDDERPTPEGWLRCSTAASAIDILAHNAVEVVSLDHDLGLGDDHTGYTVAKWIEEQAHTRPDYVPPVVRCHSDNGPGRQAIELAIRSILRARS